MSAAWTLPERPSVVVTGASSGIGEATAYRFAREKARIGLIARRADRLVAVAERVRELGGEARVAVADVADEAQVTAAFSDVETAFSGIDVLVNNAGFGLYAPLETVKRGDIERVFAVNAFGALSCMQAVLPGMRRRGRGLIVNVSSIVGKRALPMTGALRRHQARASRSFGRAPRRARGNGSSRFGRLPRIYRYGVQRERHPLWSRALAAARRRHDFGGSRRSHFRVRPEAETGDRPHRKGASRRLPSAFLSRRRRLGHRARDE